MPNFRPKHGRNKFLILTKTIRFLIANLTKLLLLTEQSLTKQIKIEEKNDADLRSNGYKIIKFRKNILTRNDTIKEGKRKTGKKCYSIYVITKFKSKSLQRDYLDSHSFFVRLKLASYTHKNQIIITEEANFEEII
jgi:hypothetical protein